MEELTQALKAYSQTEKNLKEPNPDLFFNRATIYEYLERYNEAIADYNTAHTIDQNLKADQKAGKIIDFDVEFSYSIGEENGIYIDGEMMKMDDKFIEFVTKLKTYYEKFKSKWATILASRKKTKRND